MATKRSHWQWGHPDDWSDAEWADYQKKVDPARRARFRNMVWTAVWTIALLGGAWWIGVGF